MSDQDWLAEVVVLNIKAALAPLLPRLEAIEKSMAVVTELRDRVVAVETKAALPIEGLQALRERVEGWPIANLEPLQERQAAMEARLNVLGDLRDRVVTVEAKSAAPVPVHADLDVALLDRLEALEAATDAAVVPLQDRLTGVEARLAVLGDLRDRVVVVETKAAAPVHPDTDVSELRALVELKSSLTQVDLIHIKERLAGVDDLRERVATLEADADATPEDDRSEVRDRLVALETKTSMPSLADAAVVDLKSSLVVLEERVAGVQPEIAALRERTAVLEARAPEPGPQGLPGKDGPPGLAGKDGVDGRDGKDGVAGPAGKDGEVRAGAIDDIKDLRDRVAQLEPLRERVAVVEVRAPVPGPAGKDGTPGKDGLGWDDLSVVQENERSFTVKCARGDRVKDVGTLTFAVEMYRGVYKDGHPYERGDRVTWAGSEWYCNESTSTKPGDGSKIWTLAVKRGRDGKDGKDGEPGRPGRDLTKEESGRTW